jgi:hypothetical protein
MEQQTEHYEMMEEADVETSRTCTPPPHPKMLKRRRLTQHINNSNNTP